MTESSQTRSVALHGASPLLIEIQDNLDQDISLERLARRFGYSPFHFHRLFARAVGETPKSYVERLRLEKAALLVAVTDETFLSIALAIGFRNHETFTRAFKRAFGRTPRECRHAAKRAQRERLERNRLFRGDGCSLSEVRFVRLPERRLLALRHLGAYSALVLMPFKPGDETWTALAAAADAAGVGYERLGYGIYYDDPTMTPGPAQRSDFCIPVDAEIAARDGMRCVTLAGGPYGVIEHLGPPDTIAQAYRNLADGVRRAADRYAFADGPPFQIFREVQIGGDPALNRIEVYFPLVRRG